MSDKLAPLHKKLQNLIKYMTKQQSKTPDQVYELISKVSSTRKAILKFNNIDTLSDTHKTHIDFAKSVYLPSRINENSQEEIDDHWKNIKRIHYKLSSIHTKLDKFCRKQKKLHPIKSETETKSKKKSKTKSNQPSAVDLLKSQYQMLLIQKAELLAENLFAISQEKNTKDDENWSCPKCSGKIIERCKSIKFHPCGHQTCYDCYEVLKNNDHDEKRCPICQKVISLYVRLGITFPVSVCPGSISLDSVCCPDSVRCF